LASVVLSLLLLGPRPASSDEQQNITAAYNLATYGVMSTRAPQTGPPMADMRREPLYPLLISLAVRPGDPSLECLLGPADPECRTQQLALRLVNVALIAGAVLMTFLLGRLLVRERWALAGAAVVAVSPALLQYANRALTEPLATLLLLGGTYCLIRARQDRASLTWWAVAAGACFGLLVLTKAIFLIVIPPLVLVVALRRSAFPHGPRLAAVMLATALAVVAPWSIRNAVTLGDPMPSSGASPVLAVRAASLEMTPMEYASSFAFNTGVIGPRTAALLFDEDDYRRHDRDNADSFYRTAVPLEASDVSEQLNREALETILDQPLKSLALTLPFAWSGAFGAIPIGTTTPGWWWSPLADGWVAFGVLGVAIRWLSFIAFFAVAWRSRRNPDLLCLVLPAGLLFLAYAFTSHFIARYGHPLLPIATICGAVLAQSLWTRWRASTLAFQSSESSPGAPVPSSP
jgi:4-amino-4-deoxy-L-arabinose transferase-like glycosyltransferase